jgi:DNA polymerase-3 subunit epsilon
VQRDRPGRALDDWLTHFGIPCAQRHQAAADVLATAELLLRLWPELRRQRVDSIGALERLERQAHWVTRGS